jgi:hypothetical protein
MKLADLLMRRGASPYFVSKSTALCSSFGQTCETLQFLGGDEAIQSRQNRRRQPEVDLVWVDARLVPSMAKREPLQIVAHVHQEAVVSPRPELLPIRRACARKGLSAHRAVNYSRVDRLTVNRIEDYDLIGGLP